MNPAAINNRGLIYAASLGYKDIGKRLLLHPRVNRQDATMTRAYKNGHLEVVDLIKTHLRR